MRGTSFEDSPVLRIGLLRLIRDQTET